MSADFALKRFLASGCVIFTLAAVGCGGGGGDSNAPSITGRAIVTTPTVITYVGGTAKIGATVTDPSGVNASSVKVDVIDGAGVSLIGGPQAMSTASVVDTYSYTVTLPNNISGTSNVTYTIKMTAADLKGNATPAPVIVGQVVVPFPPSPPGGP